MAIIQPLASDTLLQDNHAQMHCVIAIDGSSPSLSLYVNGSGNTFIAGTTFANNINASTIIAVTQPTSDNSTKVATTAFVKANSSGGGVPSVSNNQYFSPLYTSGTSVNWNNGNVQYIQLISGTNAFTFSNGTSGGRYMTILRQPSSGYGVGTWSSVQWPYGSTPVLTSATNNVDILTFVYDNLNSSYYGGVNLGYTQ